MGLVRSIPHCYRNWNWRHEGNLSRESHLYIQYIKSQASQNNHGKKLLPHQISQRQNFRLADFETQGVLLDDFPVPLLPQCAAARMESAEVSCMAVPALTTLEVCLGVGGALP